MTHGWELTLKEKTEDRRQKPGARSQQKGPARALGFRLWTLGLNVF
jgi:hypothetical protein